MTTELVTTGGLMPSRQEINDLALLANHLAASRRFKDSSNGYEALAKLMFGRDLGLSATAAMTGVHIVEGKPEISANIQAQMVKTYRGPDGERYDYKILEHTTDVCRIEFRRRQVDVQDWEVLGVSEYSMDDASRAGLVGKHNWKKHPKNMLFARCMSDGTAFFCPEVTNGIRTYHEGEINVDSVAAPESPATVETIPQAEEAVVDAVVVDAEVVDPEPVGTEPPVALVSIGDVDELKAAAKGLSVQQIKLTLGALGVPAPSPFEPARAFDLVPVDMAPKLVTALAETDRQEALVV